MSKPLKIVIADDHALILQGLKKVLDEQPHYQITEAENGRDALKHILDVEADVAILDVEMPEMSGFDVANQVQKQGLSIDIIFLTMFKDEAIFNKAMDIGVKGYVLKENTVSEIIKCIEAVVGGKYYLSPSISEFLIRRNNKLVTPASDKAGIHLLTPSEKTILKLVSEMKTNQEMAEELSISIKTVQNHRNNICNKLGLSGTHALLKYAMENEIK